MRMVSRVLVILLLLGLVTILGWNRWKTYQASLLPTGIVSGNGRIESVQVDITAKYPGRLKQLLVKEGDLVRPGQIVAVIDTDETEALLSKAKAQVEESRGAVAKVKADILKSESDARLAEQNYLRGRMLFQRKTISKEEYDSLVAKLDASKAEVESVKAQLTVALSSIESAISEAHRYEVQIADSTLRSPVNGRVLYKLAEEGEVLASGGKALTLINLGEVYMEIYLPSRDAALVSIGADARIVLDAVPQYAAPAQVSFVSPETQFTPKQVETPSERDKLMFRVKLMVPTELILKHIERVKTGVRGVGYVKIDPAVPWPDRLEKRFPERPVLKESGEAATPVDPKDPAKDETKEDRKRSEPVKTPAEAEDKAKAPAGSGASR